MLINYGFREMTYDVDAVILASSAMKQAINVVGDRFGLPVGWLNTDFIKTSSYSDKLVEHSTYYKTFSNALTVRTVRGEYLVAMKLMAGRSYKNDLSDIIGILMVHEENKTPIELHQIKEAVIELYGEWERLPKVSMEFITDAVANKNYKEVYNRIQSEELSNKILLKDFDRDYPGVTKESNVEEILKILNQKFEKENIKIADEK